MSSCVICQASHVCLECWRQWFHETSESVFISDHGSAQWKFKCMALANSRCSLKPRNSLSMDHHDSSFFLLTPSCADCGGKERRSNLQNVEAMSTVATAWQRQFHHLPFLWNFRSEMLPDSWQTSQCSEILHLPGNRRLPKWGKGQRIRWSLPQNFTRF